MSEGLEGRIRGVLGDHPDIAEIRMFGGLCFTLNGNMLVGTMKNGDLLARVGEAQDADTLDKPGAGPMTFTGKAMKVSSPSTPPRSRTTRRCVTGSRWRPPMSDRCRRSRRSPSAPVAADEGSATRTRRHACHAGVDGSGDPPSNPALRQDSIM